MENILQEKKDIDAVYTHDDDMGEGVASAIENAGRQDEMWMTGAGGSKAVMEKIKEGGLWRATFLYNPAMSADAVYLASLLGQGKGLPGFAAPDIPSQDHPRRHHGDARTTSTSSRASASKPSDYGTRRGDSPRSGGNPSASARRRSSVRVMASSSCGWRGSVPKCICVEDRGRFGGRFAALAR